MNDQSREPDLIEPVQEMMSDADFAMIVQEMVRSPGYHAGRARRIAAINAYRAKISLLAGRQAEEPDLPEPVQETISDEDFAMIVQEMIRSPGYHAGRARRIAAINEFIERTRNLDHSGIPADGLQFMREDEEDEK